MQRNLDKNVDKLFCQRNSSHAVPHILKIYSDNKVCPRSFRRFYLFLPFSVNRVFHRYVATRWYRAPEIMLNWMHYKQTGEAALESIVSGYKIFSVELLLLGKCLL